MDGKFFDELVVVEERYDEVVVKVSDFITDETTDITLDSNCYKLLSLHYNRVYCGSCEAQYRKMTAFESACDSCFDRFIMTVVRGFGFDDIDTMYEELYDGDDEYIEQEMNSFLDYLFCTMSAQTVCTEKEVDQFVSGFMSF